MLRDSTIINDLDLRDERFIDSLDITASPNVYKVANDKIFEFKNKHIFLQEAMEQTTLNYTMPYDGVFEYYMMKYLVLLNLENTKNILQ